MRMRLFALSSFMALAVPSMYGQLSVTGQIAANQVVSGQFNISLIPTGSSGATVALANDTRWLNATKLNGTDISTLTGLLKFTSGTPSNAAAADVIALWTSCNSGSPVLTYNGSCIASGTGGTVTSVAISAPASLFTVAGSPITGSGTLALSFATGQTANRVLASDASGNIGLFALTGAMLPNPTGSVKGGIISSTAGTNQFATGVDTSGNVTYAQPSFGNVSGSVAPSQLPTSTQVWNKYTLPYTSIQTASTTNAVTVVSLTAKQIVCGLVEKHTTAFAGTSITGLTVTVGDSNGTSTTYSPISFNILGAVTNSSAIYNNVLGASSAAGGTIQANFTSSGANLSALTQGSLDVTVCVTTLP